MGRPFIHLLRPDLGGSGDSSRNPRQLSRPGQGCPAGWGHPAAHILDPLNRWWWGSWWAVGKWGDHVGMSEPGLRQIYEAIIEAVAAADRDGLERLIAEDIVDHNAVPG